MAKDKSAETAAASFKQYREKDGKFYFKLLDAQGQVLIQSTGFGAPRDAGQAVARLQQAPAEALVELRRAYTLQKDAEIAAHVAEVLWQLGRRDEARKYFDDARRIDADNRSLKRALEKTGA